MTGRKPISNEPVRSEGGEPVLGLPLDRAEDILPEDLIQGGEIIVLLLKPSPWYILLGCLGHLLFIIGCTAVAYLAANDFLYGFFTQSEALAAGLLALLGRLTWQTLDWYFQLYVLTDRRIVTRSGILRRYLFETQLKNLQHTYMLQSLRERVCRLGTIALATAGTSAPESFWLMVARPAAVHRKIIQSINRCNHH